MKCENCEKETTSPVIDFYNMEHCSEECVAEYKKYRNKEYDNYVDPTGFYRHKALSEYE